jgi:hypothetical protein
MQKNSLGVIELEGIFASLEGNSDCAVDMA